MKNLATILLPVLVLLFIGIQPSHAQPGFGQIWEKSSANPLFSILGAPGSWNSVPVAKGFILGHGLKDDNQYKLYLGGYNGSKFSIGFVTSPGLESGWQYYAGNPVLEPGTAGEWDEVGVGAPAVIKDEGIYKMWYTGIANDPGFTERIGYATSPDGIAWTKHADNPVLDVAAGTWESDGTWMPYVIKEGNVYNMWYGGFSVGQGDTIHFSIGFATSPDGIVWTKANENPVLTVSYTPGSWTQYYVSQPVVLYDEGKYLMWFTGAVNDTTPPYQTGFAISDDGISWTKDTEHNPVLPSGAAGWDVMAAIGVAVFKEGGTYKMLYLGSDLTTYFGAGLATLVTTSIEDHSAEIPKSFALYQNYPNPFNPTTTIEFSIPEAEFVTLKVYDMLGNEAAVLVSEKLTAGKYTYQWKASGLASGVYLYRIQAGDYVEAKKMVLLR